MEVCKSQVHQCDQYITISSGNATNFGDLTAYNVGDGCGTSNQIRVDYFGGVDLVQVQ